jgi:hypothetical protein
MPNRQHEAVAIGPNRVLRIELLEALPVSVLHRSEAHGRTRMAGVRLLNCIDGQGTDGIDTQRV